MQTFNTELAIEAQSQYCNDNRLPNFSPIDGVCYRCNKDVYVPIENKHGDFVSGISVEKAARTHIIDCPHCRMSYCD